MYARLSSISIKSDEMGQNGPEIASSLPVISHGLAISRSETPAASSARDHQRFGN